MVTDDGLATDASENCVEDYRTDPNANHRKTKIEKIIVNSSMALRPLAFV
jgi:hypothetical protein